MRVAILSAGRSLRDTFDPDASFDLRIGVNSAAAMHHCDWWSCGDGQTFDRVVPIGLPAVFTLDPDDGWYRKQRRTAERIKRHRVMAWSQMKKQLPGAPDCWTNWSITAALVLAVEQGATQVHVYGHDMRGTIDVEGHELARRAELWPRVIDDWRATLAWTRESDVVVTQHGPGGLVCA